MPDGTSRFKCKGQDIKHFVSLALLHAEQTMVVEREREH